MRKLITFLHVGYPGMQLPVKGFVVMFRTLYSPKALRSFRTRLKSYARLCSSTMSSPYLSIADFYLLTVSNAVTSLVLRNGIVAFPFRVRYTASTCSRASSKTSPWAPSTIYGSWTFSDLDTFSFVTPLKLKSPWHFVCR